VGGARRRARLAPGHEEPGPGDGAALGRPLPRTGPSRTVQRAGRVEPHSMGHAGPLEERGRRARGDDGVGLRAPPRPGRRERLDGVDQSHVAPQHARRAEADPQQAAAGARLLEQRRKGRVGVAQPGGRAEGHQRDHGGRSAHGAKIRGVGPVLLVTGHAPPDRLPAFAALHAREGIEVALFGGRTRHATADAEIESRTLPFPARPVAQREIHALAASGRYRAVVCGTGGRVALPAAWAGARRGRVPFVLWASLWAHPRSAAHALSWLPLRAIYRNADAVATYGPHVSAYVKARGARRVVEAPQPVDVDFWSAPATRDERRAPFQVLFVGRPEREKGLQVLFEAWRACGLEAPHAALVLVGGDPRSRSSAASAAVFEAGRRSREELRNFYGAADVLVVPSIPTATFREPWGLVVNEAMCQRVPVIATDAVGAAAGDLVRDGETGLVVPAGDPDALAGAIRRLHDDPPERARLAAAGLRTARTHTFDAWAEGMSRALTLAQGGR
jgi:glycosyltransferase involved in cell wall biosynthesis